MNVKLKKMLMNGRNLTNIIFVAYSAIHFNVNEQGSLFFLASLYYYLYPYIFIIVSISPFVLNNLTRVFHFAIR